MKRLKYVVNYDFPGNIEQYSHRVGRAARQEGETGVAFSLLTRNMAMLAPTLVSLLQQCGQTIEPNLAQLAAYYAKDDSGGDQSQEEEEGEEDDEDEEDGRSGSSDDDDMDEEQEQSGSEA